MILKISMKLLLFMLFWTFATSYTIREKRDVDLTSEYQINCTTAYGTPGICIEFYQCYNSTIKKGGIIDTSMLRSFAPCPIGQWCCSMEVDTEKPTTITTTISTPPIIQPFSCKNMKSDDCVFCVTLHKVMDKNIKNSKAFCMGSLIHDRIILTAATCLIASKNYTLFARVPGSANKLKNYYAESRSYNLMYNSGTHYNDYGLITLSEAVHWPFGVQHNACFSNEEMSGPCVTFGLDENDKFVSTVIVPVEEKCEGIGGYDAKQVMCGNITEPNINKCFATVGAPIVCQTKNTENMEGELVGVVRVHCVKDQILLGKLSSVTDWLQSSLFDINEKFAHGD